LKDAERSRLHVFIATSEIHMKYKLKMTRQEVLDRVKSILEFAKGKFDEIEFSGEDAAPSGFLLAGRLLLRRCRLLLWRALRSDGGFLLCRSAQGQQQG